MNGKRTMLIADHAQINRVLLRKIFEADFRIVEATDGEQTLVILRDRGAELSVILLDVMIPVKSGVEVLAEMREHPELAAMPVVVMTTGDETEAEIQCLDLGAADFIAKPINARTVRHRVENVIRKREMEEERVRFRLLREQTQAQVQLKTLLDNLPGGIAILELADRPRVSLFNDTLPALAGYDAKQFGELVCRDASAVIYAIDLPELTRTIKKYVESQGRCSCDFRLRKKSGGISWVRMNASKMEQQCGQNVRLYCVMIDINREKEQELLSLRAVQELRFRADHDPLTSIYKEEAFLSATAKLLQEHPQTEYTLVRMGVKNFDAVNELLGLSAGNAILKAMASYCVETLTGSGTFGRLEGAHFALCVPSVMLSVEEMLVQLRHRFKRLQPDYDIKVVLGIYDITDQTLSVKEMCAFSQLAMNSTRSGDLPYAHCDSAMRQQRFYERELVGRVNDAFAQGQFQPYFQAVYELATGRIEGGELLVRWNHPQRGVLSAAEFIPLLEQNGTISRLDHFMMESACELLCRWRQNGADSRFVGVNCSRQSLFDSSFRNALNRVAEEYGVEPHQLIVEISESIYASDPEQFVRAADDLRRRGFQVAIDDFGIRGASFCLLTALQMDVLQLDMRFLNRQVEWERSASILEGFVPTAEKLGVKLMAKRVESKEQAEFIQKTGVISAKGYFFSSPRPLEADGNPSALDAQTDHMYVEMGQANG